MAPRACGARQAPRPSNVQLDAADQARVLTAACEEVGQDDVFGVDLQDLVVQHLHQLHGGVALRDGPGRALHVDALLDEGGQDRIRLDAALVACLVWPPANGRVSKAWRRLATRYRRPDPAPSINRVPIQYCIRASRTPL